MAERTRAYLNEEGNPRQLVTVLKGKIGGRGKTNIRDGFGNVRDVPAKILEAIDSRELHAKLTYHDPNEQT